MAWGTWCQLVCMVALVSTPHGVAGVGGWRCDACQDVVGTLRSAWPDLGVRPMTAPASLGGDDAESIIDPAPPGCTAYATGHARRSACVGQRRQLRLDDRKNYYVWAAMQQGTAPYTVCSQLGKCAKLPAQDAHGVFEASALTPGTDTAAAIGCYHATLTPRCASNPNCPAAMTQCNDECGACVWLLRSWPLFAAACAPAAPPAATPAATASTSAQTSAGSNAMFRQRDGLHAGGGQGAVDGDGVVHDSNGAGLGDAPVTEDDRLVGDILARYGHTAIEDAVVVGGESSLLWPSGLGEEAGDGRDVDDRPLPPPPASLVQVAEGAAGSRRPLSSSVWRADLAQAIIPPGRGSPSLLDAAITAPPTPSALGEECHGLYWTLSSLPDAMSSLLSGDSRRAYQWDPLTACRCLGRCPYNSVDALAVEDACGTLTAGQE